MPEQHKIPAGVVEGFYGIFYTHIERLDLIRFLGMHGFERYVYAPKNDRQHRARWWEPYPPRLMNEFAETVRVAKAAGVDFCYAISPGGSIEYRSAFDFARLTLKLAAFYALGVRSFALLLDDNEPGFRHAADAACYPSLAAAQADLTNRLVCWLEKLDSACTLLLVPAVYSGVAPFHPELVELAKLLHPAVDLCYTGPEICSPEITAEHARAFTRATGRIPILWDNYPVNDLSMQAQLHLGPLAGRSADLGEAVRGMLFNPMIQAEASKIPLLTCAAYCADPAGYDPRAAWSAALRTVAGAEYNSALRVVAEHCELSCLRRGGAALDRLAQAAAAALRAGCDAGNPAVKALEDSLCEIDEATYTLKFRMENLSLRANLLPWIEVLEHWMWMTRFALEALRCAEQSRPAEAKLARVREYEEAIRTSSRAIAAQALPELVSLAVKLAQRPALRSHRFFPFHRLLANRLLAHDKQKKALTSLS